ncbi:hypothetical protein PTSG_01709 [Salpingoeca rosetta]|uniref:IRG-type G domain-containing protein n=1 Tax=Salpingoeca rosetta (strain ATCC 50818 / BSB-021) TaxID=946362 RepID=F2TYQ5_SALR5|nr:uncharacterized protein PTSG_01709 [Salpingoeca rosetta]EGD78729.1 hypothetical protein PTSG_01709 [Salpingoeca rosetta]|eukprot:XP_004997686.1 hypothetical protein PTSG_01709 [Salpingoeca rosetta]
MLEWVMSTGSSCFGFGVSDGTDADDTHGDSPYYLHDSDQAQERGGTPPPRTGSKKSDNPLVSILEKAFPNAKFSRLRHIAVVGAPCSGKTTLLHVLRAGVEKLNGDSEPAGRSHHHRDRGRDGARDQPAPFRAGHRVYWDMPALGMTEQTAQEYFSAVGLHSVDLIVFAIGTTETKATHDAIEEAHLQQVPSIVVQTHMDTIAAKERVAWRRSGKALGAFNVEDASRQYIEYVKQTYRLDEFQFQLFGVNGIANVEEEHPLQRHLFQRQQLAEWVDKRTQLHLKQGWFSTLWFWKGVESKRFV